MSNIIRTARSRGPSFASYHDGCQADNSQEMASEMIRLAHEQADHIVAEARQAATAITLDARRQADDEQQRALANQVQLVRDAGQAARQLLERIVAEITCRHQLAVRELPQQSFDLAIAIAGRILRKRLQDCSDLVVTLVRESLEMISGCDRVNVLVAPDDLEEFADALQGLTSEFASHALRVTIQADELIGRGGCRVETEHGSIDQTIETQLNRIVDELTDAH